MQPAMKFRLVTMPSRRQEMRGGVRKCNHDFIMVLCARAMRDARFAGGPFLASIVVKLNHGTGNITLQKFPARNEWSKVAVRE